MALCIIVRFLVCVESTLVLLEIFVLHCDIVERNHNHCLTRLERSFTVINKREHFVLDQNQGFHSVMQSQFMFLKLRENCTDI